MHGPTESRLDVSRSLAIHQQSASNLPPPPINDHFNLKQPQMPTKPANESPILRPIPQRQSNLPTLAKASASSADSGPLGLCVGQAIRQAKQLANFQRPFPNRQSAIGNRQSAILEGHPPNRSTNATTTILSRFEPKTAKNSPKTLQKHYKNVWRHLRFKRT
jgi:hypothetical protein